MKYEYEVYERLLLNLPFNKVGNPLVADRNVFCVLYMIHTDRTVGYATQYKL